MEDKNQIKPFSDPYGAELEENEDDENVEVARDTVAVQQLLTHVPDVIIKCDHKKQVPYVEHFTGVCLFADISGFTSLCEKYSNLSDSDHVTCGTDQLSSTLNTYLGKIVEGILRNGGDVLKYAGDALFAMWKNEESSTSITPLINSATMCSLSIQEECDNYMTDVGVLLRVKTAVAVGVVYITYVGLEERKQFDMSGPAIDDANAAEKWAEPGSVVLSQLAWENCEQGLFIHELIEDGHHYKVLGVKHQDVISAAELTNISLFVASMTGMLTAHSMRMATPVIAKRALGPHLGHFFEKYFPYWKSPKIFRNTRRGRKEVIQADKVKVSSGIAGLMTYDPDARLLMYSQLSDQEVDDLRAYVAKPVLFKIDHHQDLEWLSEMRQVSVLFINMTLPDNVFDSAEAIQKAYEVIYETVRRLKGNLNKVFSFDKGCTFVVIFGLPGDKHDDDPARAVIAGYRIIEILHTILEITNESIGITTGRAFCGVVGHMDRHEYTVIGSKVNMAARLMMNYPNIVSCDEETYKAAISKLNKQDFDPLPSKPLKGIADPGIVREYTKDHDRIIDDDDEFDYPILGRENEQILFRSILVDIKAEESHLDSQGKFVLIVGDAGIGKTRMLEEFMDIAENEEFRMDFVEADMAHAQTPFYVVQNLITILLELEGCGSVSERETKIQAYIQNEDLKEELCLLNDLLGTHIPGHAKLIHMDDETVSEHQHLLLFEIVHQVVLKEPCIFAVENAHFIDRQSWNFLEDVVRDSHAVLVMTIKPLNTVTNLPDSAKRLVADDKTMKITLGGLPANLMIDMACQFLDVTCIPRDLEKIIREKSHGVGNWCEQLVKDLLFSNYIKVVSDKEVVIQDDKELNIGHELTSLHESMPSPVSRPCTSSRPPSTTKIFGMEMSEVPSRPHSALTRASFAAPSSIKPLASFRRRSLNLVKTFSAFRRGSVGADDCDKDEYKKQRRGSVEAEDCDKDENKNQRRGSVGADDCDKDEYKKQRRSSVGAEDCDKDENKNQRRGSVGADDCDKDEYKKQRRSSVGAEDCDKDENKNQRRGSVGADDCDKDEYKKQRRSSVGAEDCDKDENKNQRRGSVGADDCDKDEYKKQRRSSVGAEDCDKDENKNQRRGSVGAEDCDKDKYKNQRRGSVGAEDCDKDENKKQRRSSVEAEDCDKDENKKQRRGSVEAEDCDKDENKKQRRGSVEAEDCDKDENKKQRRGSTVSSKNVKIFDDDIEDEIFTGNDVMPDDVTSNAWSADSREKPSACAILTPIPRYFLSPEYFVYADSSAMVQDMHNMCIVTPGVELSRIPVPESLREMVLARFDRMPPLEKVVLKCSSILGDCFPSDLVAAIVPKSAATQVNIALYHLLKERVLECATLAHHHQHAHNHHGFIDTTHAHVQHHHHHHHHHVASSVSDMVPCGCYVSEGVKVVNLTKFLTKNQLKKQCLYLKFSSNCVQETTYGLWLKKQRESLHQKTAMHLESQAHKCRSCGGGAFLPVAMKQQDEGAGTRGSTMSSGRNTRFNSDADKRRSSRLIREKVQETGAFMSRVTNRVAETQAHSLHQARPTTIGDDVIRMDVNLKAEHEMSHRDQRNGPRHLGGVGPVLLSSGLVDVDEDKEVACDSYPDPLLANFLARTQQNSDKNITSATAEDDMVDFCGKNFGLAGIDLSKCECAEVLASVFPQLVTHWRAAGNKLKTFRYLTESGAAALATCNNMQALSYLHQVQELLKEEGHHFIANKEEKARVESLVGQAMLGMNRLDAALFHLYTALKEVGVSQPVTTLQVSAQIYKELGRLKLREIWPRQYLGNDYDACLLERARCFFHISHVYHAEGMHRQSFMAALQELNTAERLGDDFHELMTAYTSVIECSELLSWRKLSLKFETIAIKRCKQEARFLTPDDLITVSNLYAVVSTRRLGRGYVNCAVNAGLKALTIANNLNDHMLKINVIPSLAQAMILMSKIDNCHDVLKELHFAAREKDDSHGRALYYCNCFDLILETGHQLENINDCLQFTIKASIDPCLTWDFIVKYYLNASLALWHARCENWEEAESIFSAAKMLEPPAFEVIMAARGFVKLVEYKLLQLRNDHDNKTLRSQYQKTLADLFQCCKRFVVLKPRYYHLKAYYYLLCGRNNEAKLMLFKCIRFSNQIGTTLESEWAILSKHEWFDDKVKHTFTYTGHTKYPLPIIRCVT